MSDELYAVALSRDKKTYKIIHNDFGVPVHKTPEDAKTDAQMFVADTGYYKCSEPIEPLILNIGSLVDAGIIPRHRLFGSGVRS